MSRLTLENCDKKELTFNDMEYGKLYVITGSVHSQYVGQIVMLNGEHVEPVPKSSEDNRWEWSVNISVRELEDGETLRYEK